MKFLTWELISDFISFPFGAALNAVPVLSLYAASCTVTEIEFLLLDADIIFTLIPALKWCGCMNLNEKVCYHVIIMNILKTV